MSVCPLPFTQMVLYPDGSVTPCCLIGEYVIGNVKDNSLEEIWNSGKARSLRKEFLTGKTRTCALQMSAWQCHLANSHLDSQVHVAEIQEGPARRLDVRLNGQCNLECVTCNVWDLPNGVYDRTDFWKEAPKKLFPHLLEICVLGGEPFIQKDTFRLIDEISAVNASCAWMFTTNAHWNLNPFIEEKLDRIHVRSIIVSVDSLDPEVFRKIRVKGELERALQGLRQIQAYRARRSEESRFHIGINMVVQQSNYLEIPRFLDFCREEGLELTLTPLFRSREPGGSLLHYGAEKRRQILAWLHELQVKQPHSALQPLIQLLEESLTPRFLLDAAVACSLKSGRSASGN